MFELFSARDPLINHGPDQVCQTSHSDQLDAELARAVDRFPIPESATAALASESVDLFAAGLPREDARLRHAVEVTRRVAVYDMEYIHGSVYGQRVAFQPHTLHIAQTETPKTDRAVREAIYGSMQRGTAAQVRDWANEQEASVEQGLRLSQVYRFILPNLQLNYYHAEDPVWHENVFDIAHADPDDLQELFDGGEVPAGFTSADLATRLQELGRTDYSLPTLNARLENFMGLAQLELPAQVLKELISLARCGRRNYSAAYELSRRYHDDLMGNDLARKQQIMLEVAGAIGIAANNIKDQRRMSRGLAATGDRLRNMAVNFDEFMMYFNNVYDALGYSDQKPAALVEWFGGTEETAEAPEGVSHAVGAVVVTTVVAEAPAVVAPDAEALARIESEAAALATRAESEANPWRMNAKARKPHADAITELTNGVRNALNTQVLPPMMRDTAIETVAVIARIQTLSVKADPSRVATQLRSAIERHRELLAQFDALRQFASSVGYKDSLSPPAVPDIARRLQTMAENIPTFRQFILKTWDPATAVQTADALEAVLQAFVASLQAD